MTGTTERAYLEGKTPTVQPDLTPTPLGLKKLTFLVSVLCTMDDVAVRLFKTYEEAMDFVLNNPPFPSYPEGREQNHPLVNKAYRITGRDYECILGYSIFTFEDDILETYETFLWEDLHADGTWKLPEVGWLLEYDSEPQHENYVEDEEDETGEFEIEIIDHNDVNTDTK